MLKNDEQIWGKVTRGTNANCDSIDSIYRLTTPDANVVFGVGGNEELVPSHKCILAFHSPFFRRILNRGDIKSADTTIDAFVGFMTCFYCWELPEAFLQQISVQIHFACNMTLVGWNISVKSSFMESLDKIIKQLFGCFRKSVSIVVKHCDIHASGKCVCTEIHSLNQLKLLIVSRKRWKEYGVFRSKWSHESAQNSKYASVGQCRR